MKTLFLIIALIFCQLTFSQYTWTEIGPPDIQANKMKTFQHPLYECACIFTDDGMYVSQDYWSGDWTFIEEPLIDAAYYSENELIVIFSEGSYSDGIYLYNLELNTIEIIEWGLTPQFIGKIGYDGRYYVGFPNGLWTSEDGIIWEEDSFFTDKNCLSVANNPHYDHMAILTDESINNVYYLEDIESEWEQINSDFKMSGITIGHYLGGICTDDKSDNGFYKCGGYDWDLILSSENLSAIGHDNEGSFFIGWNGTSGDHQGVARYKGNELAFYNAGLPNMNIRGFATDYNIVGGGIIYCLTDSGIFTCNGYTTGMKEFREGFIPEFSIFPNPADKEIFITKMDGITVKEINIYNQNGQREIQLFEGMERIDVSSLSKGIYIVEILTSNFRFRERLVIR